MTNHLAMTVQKKDCHDDELPRNDDTEKDYHNDKSSRNDEENVFIDKLLFGSN